MPQTFASLAPLKSFINVVSYSQICPALYCWYEETQRNVPLISKRRLQMVLSEPPPYCMQ
jgi:hypothetical protein